MAKNKTSVSPLMLELSRYIAQSQRRRLPAPVVERAKLHLIDTFAAMISGSRLLPGQRAIAYVKPQGGTPLAGVIGTRIVTTPVLAALANGMFGHADETDDTHPPSLTHPGTSVVPAALAIGEAKRLSGAAMLRAIVLGYDICSRLLLALKPMPFLRSGHHAGAFGQAFGAAAQLRVRRDVRDLLAVDPDLAPRLAQPVEKLRTGPCAHAASFPHRGSRSGCPARWRRL